MLITRAWTQMGKKTRPLVRRGLTSVISFQFHAIFQRQNMSRTTLCGSLKRTANISQQHLHFNYS